jgi:hypothetical protein
VLRAEPLVSAYLRSEPAFPLKGKEERKFNLKATTFKYSSLSRLYKSRERRNTKRLPDFIVKTFVTPSV